MIKRTQQGLSKPLYPRISTSLNDVTLLIWSIIVKYAISLQIIEDIFPSRSFPFYLFFVFFFQFEQRRYSLQIISSAFHISHRVGRRKETMKRYSTQLHKFAMAATQFR